MHPTHIFVDFVRNMLLKCYTCIVVLSSASASASASSGGVDNDGFVKDEATKSERETTRQAKDDQRVEAECEYEEEGTRDDIQKEGRKGKGRDLEDGMERDKNDKQNVEAEVEEVEKKKRRNKNSRRQEKVDNETNKREIIGAEEVEDRKESKRSSRGLPRKSPLVKKQAIGQSTGYNREQHTVLTPDGVEDGRRERFDSSKMSGDDSMKQNNRGNKGGEIEIEYDILIDEADVRNDSTDRDDIFEEQINDPDAVTTSSAIAGNIAAVVANQRGKVLSGEIHHVNAQAINTSKVIFDEQDEESHQKGYTCHDNESTNDQIKSENNETPRTDADNKAADSYDRLVASAKRKSLVLDDLDNFFSRAYSSDASLVDDVKGYFSFSYSGGQKTNLTLTEGSNRQNQTSEADEETGNSDHGFSLVL